MTSSFPLRACLGIVLLALCLAMPGPVAHAQSAADSPLLEPFRRLDSEIATENMPSQPSPQRPPQTTLDAVDWTPPEIPSPQMPARRNLSPAEALNPPALTQQTNRTPATDPRQVPVLAVIDLESDTVDPSALLTLTQAVWVEAQRAQRTRMLELDTTRHVLARHNLTPSDPYRPPPSRHQLAAVLNADYLILGEVDRYEKTYYANLWIYSASSNSLLKSATEISQGGFPDLLDKFPDNVQALMNALPAIGAAGNAAASPVASQPLSQPVRMLQKELEQLRLENDRLRARLAQLGQHDLPNLATTPTPMPQPEASAMPISPVRVDTELPPVKSDRKRPVRKKARLRPDPTPTALVVAEATQPTAIPSPAPTARPTASPIAAQPTASEAGQGSTGPTPTPAPVRPPLVAEASPTPMPERAPSPSMESMPEPGSPEAKAMARKFYDESYKYPFNSRKGLEPLERAVMLDPNNPDYQQAYVTRLFYCGDYSDCARLGDEFAAAGSKNPEVHIFTGAAYTALAEYQKALVAIERALRLSPDNLYALYNRAMNLYFLNDLKAAEAFRYYLKKAQNDPKQSQYVPQAEKYLRELEAAMQGSGGSQ